MTEYSVRTWWRLIAALAAVTLALLVQPATLARATNPDTKSGLNTTGCAVSWYAQSDLSTSYTQDYDGDGTIAPGEVYSNRGYLYEVSSSNTYPAVHGPGDFLLHHWANTNTSLGFRLPLATDHTMHDVTVTIKADSSNFTLSQPITSLGLAKYVAIDGNAKYTTQAPAPTVSYADGAITLHWDVIPVGSADIYSFGGTATDGQGQNPESHYLVSASLTATYAEGSGCAGTVPAVPAPPITTGCQVAVAGRTIIPLGAGDVTDRIKTGEGAEVNADSWSASGTRYLRLYAATDKDLTDATITFTAAQGFTFKAGSLGTVLTATNMGALDDNGYTVAATGIGTPVISADGKTVTLTVASMPAMSAIAFSAVAVPDGSLRQLVMDSTFVATDPACVETTPELPATPTEEPCEQVVTGRTIIPVGAGDVTDRQKYGDGAEVNADSWIYGGKRYARVYAATDTDLTDVTITWTAAQGFTFDPANLGQVLTAANMGALDDNGYTVAATGIGTPTVSADGKTLTLTVASMPAKSAVAINGALLLHDGSGKQLVMDSVMSGTIADCWITDQPAAPEQTQVCGPVDNDTVTIPADTSTWTYTSTGWVDGKLTVTAVPAAGHVFAEGVTTEWTFTDVSESCFAGCTYTQGYWKTHPATWPTGYSPSNPFFQSGQTWLKVMNTSAKSGVYYQLAYQYIAAELNVASGAAASAEVTNALAQAESFFASATPKTKLTRAQQAELLKAAALLDAYNNGTGYYGPYHCGY
ncbi:hypothetical protein ACQP1U_02905 [Actinomycetota bacterium]